MRVENPASAAATAPRCPRCGAALDGYGPEGLCGACMLDSALNEEAPTSTSGFLSTGPQRFGDYELLEEIARGGMGVIYKARQVSLNRTVAVKMILSGQFAGVAELARFRAEAATAARLQHPHIVAIHEVGEQNGQPFFSMDYVEGQNLAQLVGNAPLPAARAAKYVKAIAEAVEYAHQQGVLHRDLKPSNVLIDTNDQPRVTDFGLAKRLNDSQLSTLNSQQSLTITGQVLGSPNFMSPEQAEGEHRAIGPASDVYALGAMLYHLLTGRPPFVAETMTATLRLVAETEPVSPRLLNGSVPRDLETICLKCLEKDPHRRYASAHELVEELERVLRDEPIRARSVGQTEKFWRWCRRNPVPATLLAALVLVGAAGLAGILWQLRRADREAHQAVQNAEQARRQERLATEQELLARRRFYAAQMNLASQAWEAGLVPRTLELLETQRPRSGQADLRGFEWHYLLGLCNARQQITLQAHASEVMCVALSPDGSILASGGADGTIRLWDRVTRREVQVLRLEPPAKVDALAFTPDGKTLASGSWDVVVRLWDVAKGRVRAELAGHPNRVRSLAISPDGKLLASGGEAGAVKLWDLKTCEPRGDLPAHRGPVVSVAFSPDNAMLATAAGWGESEGGLLVLWELTGSGHRVRWKIADAIESVAFSPDGQTLATARWDQVRLMRAADGSLVASLAGHAPRVTEVAFFPDDKTLVSCAADRTIRTWSDWKSGNQTNSTIIGAHFDAALCLALTRDGTVLASGANDGTVSLWNVADPQIPLGALRQGEFKSGASADQWKELRSVLPLPGNNGVFVVTGTGVEWWDVAAARKQAAWPEQARNGALTLDGRLLATINLAGVLKLWETASGRLLASVPAHAGGMDNYGVFALAFSPDGRTLATAAFGYDMRVRLWDTSAGLRPIRDLLAARSIGMTAVGFSPDGRTLAAATRNQQVQLFDLSTGEIRGVIKLGSASAFTSAVIFSPDGWLLATGGEGIARLWDVQTGQPHVALKGHTGTSSAIAFSPDGATVVTGGNDLAVRLWDVATGQERISLKVPAEVQSVSFGSDGATLFAGLREGTVKIWRGEQSSESIRTAEPTDLLPPLDGLDHSEMAWSAILASNSERAVSLALAANRLATNSADLESDWPLAHPHPAYLDTLCAAYYRAGRYDSAREAYLRAATSNSAPFSAKGLFFVAMTHQQLGKRDEAMDAYVKALAWWKRQSWLSGTEQVQLEIIQAESEKVLGLSAEAKATAEKKAVLLSLPPIHVLPRPPDFPGQLLDLSAHYTRGPDRALWFDPTPATARTRLLDLEFDVRGAVELAGERMLALGERFPEKVEGILVQRRCRRLHFLHGARHAAGLNPEEPVASYWVEFEDQQRVEIPLRHQRELLDWEVANDAAEAAPPCREAWRGTMLDGKQHRLFLFTWDNPRPNVLVTTLDFSSRKTTASPFVVAITAE